MPEQDKVETPEPVTPVGFIEQVSPVSGEVVGTRLTLPEKPNTEPIVMVEVPVWLA